MCEISASIWFYYKEICYDAWLHERKKKEPKHVVAVRFPINKQRVCIVVNLKQLLQFETTNTLRFY